MSGFRIRHFEPGDEEQVLQLFNRVFGETNPDFVPRDMATWRHIYEANPQGHRTLVGLDEQGRIVANYSSCAVAVRVDGRPGIATQVIDSCVDKAWRRSLGKSSLFFTIAMAYQREFCDPAKPGFNDFSYGLPNEMHFPIGTRLLGYEPVLCPLPRQQRVADERWVAEFAARAGGVTAETVGWEALDTLAALFAQHASGMLLGIWRDAGYLAWRFRDWPDAPYRLALARRAGQPCGAVVYRVGVPWEKNKVTAVLEWAAPGDDPAVLAALLGHVAAVGLAEGHARLETWVTPAMPHRASLLALGLAEEPTRFNLCIMLYRPGHDIRWVRQHWWLTMGDTDIY